MTQPNDPQKPTYDEPVVAQPDILDPAPDYVAPGNPAPTPVTPTAAGRSTTNAGTEQAEESEKGAVGKAKAAALLAGAAALANKVRQETPKKLQDIRQKRAAGRCVILTERDGQLMAIGPYADEHAARQDSIKIAGDPRVVELTTQQAYFGPQDRGSGTAP